MLAGVWLCLITSLCRCELGKKKKSKGVVCNLWTLALSYMAVRFPEEPRGQCFYLSYCPQSPLLLGYVLLLVHHFARCWSYSYNLCGQCWQWSPFLKSALPLRGGCELMCFFFKTCEPQSFFAQKTWKENTYQFNCLLATFASAKSVGTYSIGKGLFYYPSNYSYLSAFVWKSWNMKPKPTVVLEQPDSHLSHAYERQQQRWWISPRAADLSSGGALAQIYCGGGLEVHMFWTAFDWWVNWGFTWTIPMAKPTSWWKLFLWLQPGWRTSWWWWWWWGVPMAIECDCQRLFSL